MRLILFIVVIYLVWRFLKSWTSNRGGPGAVGPVGSDKHLDDIMVQDPYCQVYFPKRSGCHIRTEGEDLYFCSEECRDNFMADRLEQNKI